MIIKLTADNSIQLALAENKSAAAASLILKMAPYIAGAGGGGSGLLVANNLSDVENAATSRTNLGLEIGTDVQGYSAVLAATTGTFRSTDETKLDAIDPSATANDTDANLVSRANHTGTQTLATISDSGALAALDSVEGTAIDSTGEVGGSKFLREDGDGSSSWQAITGGGDMLAANNLSEVTAATARTNLGLIIDTDVQGYSAVLAATTASFLAADETKLDAMGSIASMDVWTGNQATYDGLGSYDSNTVYLVTG